jgi:virginiamycin B lyase
MRSLILGVLTALAFAASASADLFEYPTCVPPPGFAGDTAACSSGRSPNPVVKGPDGAMWFGLGSAELGRLDPATGGLTVYPVPGGQGVFGLTNGPDGALWFTEYRDSGVPGRIGRMTLAGAFTFFALDADVHAGDIITGADGALWFTAPGKNAIGRITTAGAVSYFALPAGPSLGEVPVDGIAQGPDGRLLWCGGSSDRLGTITMAGAVVAFPLPDHGGCHSLTLGPDGAIWAPSFSNDAVYRVALDGTRTTFPLPGAGPSAITRIGDAFYVGASGTAQVLRMTTTGATTAFPVSAPAAINGLTAGTSDEVWFTNAAGARVGRLTTGGATIPPPPAPPASTPPTSADGPAIRVVPPVSAQPRRPTLRGRRLLLPVRATGAGTYTITVLARGRKVAGAKGVFGSATSQTLRLTLTRRLKHGAKVDVLVRLKAGPRTSVSGRRFKV